MLTCPRSSLSFHSNAHHHGSLPQQLGVVWDLLLKADPEGPSPIFHAALRHRFHTHTGARLLHVSLQHTLVKKLELCVGIPAPGATLSISPRTPRTSSACRSRRGRRCYANSSNSLRSRGSSTATSGASAT